MNRQRKASPDDSNSSPRTKASVTYIQTYGLHHKYMPLLLCTQNNLHYSNLYSAASGFFFFFFFFLQIWLHRNIYFTKLYMCIVFNTCFSCFNFCILTTIILPKVCLNVCECVWVCVYVCVCVCMHKIYHDLYNFWGLISLNILLWSIHFAIITFVHSFLTAP